MFLRSYESTLFQLKSMNSVLIVAEWESINSELLNTVFEWERNKMWMFF